MSVHRYNGESRSRAPQRLVILDYRGTLDIQRDPIAIVRTLVNKGDVVVLWSGNGSAVSKDLKGAFTYVISKFSSLKGVIETVREQGHTIDQVVVSDDNFHIKEAVEDLGWVYWPPDRLVELAGAV